MKKLLLIIPLTIVVMGAYAQERDTTYWSKKGITGLNLSQVSLNNWAAGGDGSVAFDATFNYSADYAKDRHIWQNRLEMTYGLSNTSSNGTRKTNDNLYLSSTYGYQISKRWYLSAFVTYQTQFAKGYDYAPDPRTTISKFMSPGYLSLGPGLTWIPKKWFKATFSPTTWRGTFVLDKALSDAGAFGVDPGKHLLSEFGGSATMEINYEFLKNMTLISRLNLFSNYLEKPKNVDVRWDVLVNMKINKWFAANFTFNMIYDDDVKIANKDGHEAARLQVKEALGIGFQATF